MSPTTHAAPLPLPLLSQEQAPLRLPVSWEVASAPHNAFRIISLNITLKE